MRRADVQTYLIKHQTFQILQGVKLSSDHFKLLLGDFKKINMERKINFRVSKIQLLIPEKPLLIRDLEYYGSSLTSIVPGKAS